MNQENDTISQMLDVAGRTWAQKEAFETVAQYDLGLLGELFPDGATKLEISTERVGMHVQMQDDAKCFLVDIVILNPNEEESKLVGGWVLYPEGFIDDDTGRQFPGAEPVIGFVRKMFNNSLESERYFE